MNSLSRQLQQQAEDQAKMVAQEAAHAARVDKYQKAIKARNRQHGEEVERKLAAVKQHQEVRWQPRCVAMDVASLNRRAALLAGVLERTGGSRAAGAARGLATAARTQQGSVLRGNDFLRGGSGWHGA